MSVVLAGGGTAGHIEPALALADALRRADPQLSIVCLGTERGLETRLVPLRGYELALIPPVPLPRQLTPQLLSVPGRLSASVSAAARVLAEARADVLVGFGGYVATPGYLAARRHHVPIVVHDAHARPGPAQPPGPPVPHPRVPRPARHQAAARPLHRDPAAPRDRQPGPAGPGGQGPRALPAAGGTAGGGGSR